MHTTGFLTLLAAGASLVSATYSSGTITLTSTTTRTIVITQCDPTVTNCPLKSYSSSPVPVETTTQAANSSTYSPPVVKPSTPVPVESSSVVVSSVEMSSLPSVPSSGPVRPVSTPWAVLNSTSVGPTAVPPTTIVTARPSANMTSMVVATPSTMLPSGYPTGAASGFRASGGLLALALAAAGLVAAF